MGNVSMPHPQAVDAPGRTVIRKLSTTALISIVIAIGLSSVGVVYQMVGTWLDAKRFPEQGRLVQAGNIRLNIDCMGQGSPSVILESGLTIPAVGWTKVEPEVAKFTRVCSYDRAGYGWSDPGPEPRSSNEIARELKAVLDNASEKGPYVLVGHSFGGFNVRVFTHLYPAEVAGVVLVDASHEDEGARIDALLPDSVKAQEKRNDEWNERVNRLMTPLRLYFGIQRFEVAHGWSGSPYLSRDLREEVLYLRQQRKSRQAVASESNAFAESIKQVRSAGDLGDRPLIVLTAGKPYDPDPLLTTEQMDRQNDLWIHDLQAQEARLSTRGKQIVVADSSHMIPYERPDTIVSAIHEVWSALQIRIARDVQTSLHARRRAI
jgi:pimeloyl-ACP methyl ester carboxylesterase